MNSFPIVWRFKLSSSSFSFRVMIFWKSTKKSISKNPKIRKFSENSRRRVIPLARLFIFDSFMGHLGLSETFFIFFLAPWEGVKNRFWKIVKKKIFFFFGILGSNLTQIGSILGQNRWKGLLELSFKKIWARYGEYWPNGKKDMAFSLRP